VQETIDRRFYRQKYSAEQALAQFAETAGKGTDLENITGYCCKPFRKQCSLNLPVYGSSKAWNISDEKFVLFG
jgi:hypothetical protein